MAGLKIVLPLTFSDATLPILRDDAILTAGSLALIDFTHSANPLAAGVPANGAAIPNIAWKEAAALHGSGTQAEWALAYNQVMTTGAGADGFVERSGKGGIHVVMSQSTAAAGKGVSVGKTQAGAAATKLSDYLFGHLDNSFYLSIWERITRVGLTDSPEGLAQAIYGSTAATTTYLALARRTVNSGAALSANPQPALPQPVGNDYRSMSVTGYTSTKPTSSALTTAAIMNVGSALQAYTGFGANKGRSTILYRATLEDLTVSGRTFAQVDAIDKALFNAAFAVGGRYYGDTFTDPATYA